MRVRLVVGVLSFLRPMTGIFPFNLFAACRSLYPDGKYADHARAAIVSAAVGMFATASCIGVIPLAW
jgi:hypothetical protein